MSAKQKFAETFGVEIERCTLSNIQAVFESSGVEESQYCEIKQSINEKGDLFDKLGKAVCGFANTEGGFIIVGGPVDNGDASIRGSLTFTKYFSKDKIHNSISDSITPHLTAIHVITLQDTNNSQRCIIILLVESSIHKPFQHKGTYYIRVGDKTKEAPHSVIIALFLTREVSRLKVYLKLKCNYNSHRNIIMPYVKGYAYNEMASKTINKIVLEVTLKIGEVQKHYYEYFENNLYYGKPYTFAANFADNRYPVPLNEGESIPFLLRVKYYGYNCFAGKTEYTGHLQREGQTLNPTIEASIDNEAFFDEENFTRKQQIADLGNWAILRSDESIL